MTAFPKDDPTLAPFYESAYGWAVFENAGKGAFIVGLGGAGGEVYAKKDGGEAQMVGKCTLVTASAGWSVGIEVFSEIVFFETQEVFEKYAKSDFDVGLVGSAVVLTAAAKAQTGSNVGYKDGVAVFVRGKFGGMIDGSLQGQMYKYREVE
jgi:lipid-binding SYLF domain-containing protein